MRDSKPIAYIVSFLLVISISLFVMLLNINLNIFNENLYKKEFLKHDVYNNLKGINIEQINREVLEYLNGKGALKTDFFTEREKEHLRDVKNLIQIANRLLMITAFVSIILILFLFLLLERRLFLIYLSVIFFISKIMLLLISFILIILVGFNFQNSFNIFHRLFFEQGSWLFDPANEKIVALYPSGLFYDIGIRIIMFNLVSSVLLLALSLIGQNLRRSLKF